MSTKVIVEAVSTKPVTTKFGEKQTYSFKGHDGQWYKMGFKKPQFNSGDEVEFEFTSTKYGNEVTAVLSAPTATATAPAAAGPSKAPYSRATGSSGGYSRGVFPIPPTDGQRSIIRQNSLTNALKFLEVNGMEAKNLDEVISIARKFEAYSAGDTEAATAMKALKEASDESREG